MSKVRTVSFLCSAKSDRYCYDGSCECDCHFKKVTPKASNQKEARAMVAQELNKSRAMLPITTTRSVIVEKALVATGFEFNADELKAFLYAFGKSDCADFDPLKFERDYVSSLVTVSQVLF